MKKIRLALALAGIVLVPTISRAQYADAVISYAPGTGFATGFTNTSAALGAPASGALITPFAPPSSKSQIVSIGAGGEITLQLGTPITNAPLAPYGIDFILFANEFFVSSNGTVSSLFYHTASMQVQVSTDDSTWYTLNPSLAPQAGELYPTYGGGNPLVAVNPSLTLANFTGQNLAGVESLYIGSAGGTGYSLAWAEDANSNSVDVASANYVRIEVQSGVLDLDAISVVPEPAAGALLSAGAVLFWLRRRAHKHGKNATVSRHHLSLLPFLLVLAGLVLVPRGARAQCTTNITLNFAANPLQNGWQVFGDTTLFHWDSTNDALDVTWDSSQTNSYFYYELGTVLTREDAFIITFDFVLNDATATGNSFQVAVGLLNLAEATSTNFLRGTAVNSPDLVEFDYFPDVGYGPTVWPTFFDSDSDLNWNGPSDYAVYAPTPGDVYHVQMFYDGASQSMLTTLTDLDDNTNLTIVDPLAGYFTDFQVDTISISSYSGLDSDSSLLAHGELYNIALQVLPPPLIRAMTGAFSNSFWQVQFGSRTNWLYTLERTADFVTWSNVTVSTAGNGTNLVLQDPGAPADKAYYRVLANRP